LPGGADLAAPIRMGRRIALAVGIVCVPDPVVLPPTSR